MITRDWELYLLDGEFESVARARACTNCSMLNSLPGYGCCMVADMELCAIGGSRSTGVCHAGGHTPSQRRLIRTGGSGILGILPDLVCAS